MRIATVPLPAPGEALDGYLDRAAALHHVTMHAIAASLNVETNKARGALAPRIAPTIADLLDSGLGLPPGSTQAMTLAYAYRRQLPHLAAAQSAREVSLAAPRDWFFMAGSRYCPQCLATDGVWRLHWRIPMSIACLEHGALLVDQCPECNGFPRSAAEGHTSPRHLWEVARHPLRCTCQQDKQHRAQGRAGRPCNADLTRVQTQGASVTDLQHQHRISLTLAGQHSKMAGRFRSAHEVLTGLRELYVLYARSSGTRQGHRRRIWRTPPRSTVAVSIAMAAVSDVVEADTIADAAEALRAFAVQQSIDLNANFFRDNLSSERALDDVYQVALRGVGRYATRLRRVKSEAQDTLPLYTFPPTAVPQLVWVCTIPGALTDRNGRPSLQIVQAVISLSLVRLVVGEMSVSEEHLQFPSGAGRRWTRYVVNQLNEHEKEQMLQAVTDTAHLLSNCQDWQLPPMPRLRVKRALDLRDLPRYECDGLFCAMLAV